MAFLRNELQRRRDVEARIAAVLFGRVGQELGVEAQQVGRHVQFVEEQADTDVRHRMQLELEGRHNAEIAATAAQRPEQVGVLRGTRGAHPSVGGDHLGRQQVVDAQPILAGQVADAAAQRQPAHPGGGHDAAGRGQAEQVGGVVDVAPGGAAGHRARRVPGSTVTSRMPDRSMTSPSSLVP